jgi:hypothetical protein
MPGRLDNKRNKTILYIGRYITCISFYLINFYYTLFGDLPFVNTEWSRRPDSNRGPTVYKTVALPLSYAGRDILFAKISFTNTLNWNGKDLNLRDLIRVRRFSKALP